MKNPPFNTVTISVNHEGIIADGKILWRVNAGKLTENHIQAVLNSVEKLLRGHK